MAKNRKKVDMKRQEQLSLFALLTQAAESARRDQPCEGSGNVRERLRTALCSAIKQCPLSRWEIAGKMSHLLGQEVSKFMVDAWTAESKDGHRMPAEFLPTFCMVTEDNGPLRVLAEVAGLFALPGPDALRAEIQKLDEEARQIGREKRKRELFLREMEK